MLSLLERQAAVTKTKIRIQQVIENSVGLDFFLLNNDHIICLNTKHASFIVLILKKQIGMLTDQQVYDRSY